MTSYDVAVVGAGPVGVVAANLCGVHGLSAVAFDREKDVYDLPRAAALYDDAQRILDNAGVLAAVLPATCEMAGGEFVDARGKRIIGLDIPAGLRTPNGYPPLLNINQPGVEASMRRCLATHREIVLELGQEVVRLEPGPDHVDLVVRDRSSGEVRTVRARWVIGCDGASSFVRKSHGIGWHSLGYDCEWLVIDLELTRDVPLPVLCQQICDPARPTTVIPMPGALRRWEFQLKPGETRAEMEDPARIWELLRPWLSRDDARLLRTVVYRFHSTIADRFQDGRVFLAGDAAHQTPPFMGQGLCTGIRDVENLVWKLAMVSTGKAADSLLDTYTLERRPLAMAMVEHSTNTGKLIDAYAAMERGGPEPSAELKEYAYGGARTLPSLSNGLLTKNRSVWTGQLIPAARIRTAARTGGFDELVGPRWAVVTRDGTDLGEARSAITALAASIDAVEGSLAGPDPYASAIFDEHEAVLVRPDRVIYGGARYLDFVALAREVERALRGG